MFKRISTATPNEADIMKEIGAEARREGRVRIAAAHARNAHVSASNHS